MFRDIQLLCWKWRWPFPLTIARSNNRTLHNANVSEDARVSAEERLHQLPEQKRDKNIGHVIARIKACIPLDLETHAWQFITDSVQFNSQP